MLKKCANVHVQNGTMLKAGKSASGVQNYHIRIRIWDSDPQTSTCPKTQSTQPADPDSLVRTDSCLTHFRTAYYTQVHNVLMLHISCAHVYFCDPKPKLVPNQLTRRSVLRMIQCSTPPELPSCPSVPRVLRLPLVAASRYTAQSHRLSVCSSLFRMSNAQPLSIHMCCALCIAHAVSH